MITRFSHHMFKVFLIALIGITATSAQMGDAAQQQSIFDVLSHKEVLEFTLETNVNDLKTNRKTEEYQTGFIRFSDADKIEQAWKVKVRPRGKFRRRNCAMPPLKLKFKKAELATAGLAEFNDLKLVTHCSESKLEAKEWLAKEYIAYKLYNELTPNSFRVQMVKITYLDVPTGKKTKNWGFLIEDKKQVASRMGATIHKNDRFNIENVDVEHEKLMTVYQYLIGNEDWDMAMVRNLKLMNKNGKLIPVPYDFDFSGLVNTNYAIPNTNYGLASITDRYYLGTIQPDNDISATLKFFKSKQKNLVKTIRNFKTLNFEGRATTTDYVQSFYQNLDDNLQQENSFSQGMNYPSSNNISKQP